MVAKRGLTNRANVHTATFETHQHDRIPIDPAILAAIGHCFTAKKIKMTTRADQKPELFIWGGEEVKSQDLQTGCPNWLFFEKECVQMLNLLTIHLPLALRLKHDTKPYHVKDST